MLQIRLLGQFDVRLAGKRILIPSRAGQSLLAYLVLTAGTPHRREKLAGILWPDFSEDNARKNLRHELWRIRKAFSSQQPAATDYLLAEEFTIAFNREVNYWLDAKQLERPEIDQQSLISNLSLYQGELLPGFYEDWIVLERERIRGIFDSKMEQLLGQLTAAERWTAVQEQAERWLSLGHTLEPAYRALMLAYGARGDMAKVSSLYQRCMNELNEQFGLEPSAETRALYDGLLKGAHIPARAVQSSGTVTFLFTDIEESTNLLDKLGDQYATVLTEHHEILRAAIRKWNGREMDTQGDAFFVTFARSLDAVQCACEAQRAFASHRWLHNEPLRVRMGLHTGEPLIASTGYIGMDVHRAARIGDAAHGGQVLLSQTTRELVAHDLPKGVTIRDLGEHRLKDLKFPTPIYQLVIEGLSHDFPPLRTKFTGSEAPTPGEPPFKGLQYFDEADSDLFFGRELLTAKLIDRLRGAQFLSVIIGASGSGKSSLARAGLIPALKKGNELIDGTKPPEGSSNWRVHILTPTAHPIEALAIELTRDSESVTATATLMDDLVQDPRSLALFLARRNQNQHTLLVVDQFEELFTLCRDEFEREAFIDNLLTAINSSPEEVRGVGNITLILTLRADFYAHLAQYPELRDAVAKQQEYIGPMTTEELRRAIEEPARRAHWTFEPGLVDLILRDVGDEPGALPLLSHALLETWKRRAGYTLTLKGYADAGGVRGAIAHTAESVYQNLSTDEQAIARNIFMRLTELGEGTEDTRRRASFDELMSHTEDLEEVRPVLNKLAEARLITLGEDTAEVAHEALIREWPALREWLNQDREGLQLHRRLTETAREWELLERDAGVLYRGTQLAQAREWAALHPRALNVGERAFLDASDALEHHEQGEREAQQQRELEAAQKLAETERQRAEEQSLSAQQLRKRAVYLTGAFVIALVMAVAAIFFGRQAQTTSRLATSREIAGSAINNLDVDPERSILLAMQAVTTTYAVDGTTTKEARDALHRAVLNSRLRLALYSVDGYGLAFSPDGKWIATSTSDGQIKLWDLTSREELFTLSGHEGMIGFIAFSPDGSRLASASADGTAKVWDLDTRQVIYDLSGHLDVVSTVAYSQDGKRIVTSSFDGTARVWDAANGEVLLTFTGHEKPVSSAQFSPDGSRVATAGEDSTVRVWDSVSGQELYELSDFLNFASGATFSPDGKLLATNDGNDPKLWDAETGALLFLLSGSTSSGSAQPPVFTPDGKYVAVAGQDGTVSMWETATGVPYLTFATGTPIDGRQIEFSPGCVDLPAAPYAWCGVYLVTGNRDGSVRFWDVSPAGNREVLTGPRVPGWSCLASDGMTLHTASVEPEVHVQFRTQRLPQVSSVVEPSDPMTFAVHELSSYTVGTSDVFPRLAFTPDCSRSAVIDLVDFDVTITDTASGNQVLQFKLPAETTIYQGPGSSSFSPDGTRLAMLGPENTVIVWDLENDGKELLTLQGHTAAFTTTSFSPDGQQLATASHDKTVKLWDAETGQELHTFTGHTQPTTRVVFNAQGTRLATGSFDGTAKVWDLETRKELLTLSGHGASVWGIGFSPDGKYIATGSNDLTLRLWDAMTGEELLAIPIPAPSFQVFFSPDQTLLVAQTTSGMNVYLPQIEDLFALAKSRVTRSLTTEECQQYLHMEQCPSQP